MAITTTTHTGFRNSSRVRGIALVAVADLAGIGDLAASTRCSSSPL